MKNKIALAFLIMAGAALWAQQITFQNPASTTFKAPVAVISGDFNGDGRLDLAVVDVTARTIKVMLGKGDGTFSAGTNYSPSDCVPTMLAAGDFTNDGITDLITYCEPSDSYAVLPGRRDGSFGPAIYTRNGTIPLSATYVWNGLGATMAIADLNGDGKLDIAVATIDGYSARNLDYDELTWGGQSHEQLVVMLGRGDGTFTTPAVINLGSRNAVSAVAGDFNGDGKPDLAVSVFDAVVPGIMPNASIAILLNDGQANFTLAGMPTTDMIAPNLRVADLNGDGKADILLSGPPLSVFVTGNPASQVAAFLGDGNGNISRSYTAQNSGFDSIGCLLADVRGTGHMDIVEQQVTWEPGGGGFSVSDLVGQMVFRPGNGDGTFQAATTLALPQSEVPTGVAGGDFDGDGRYDLAILHVSAAQASQAYANVQSPLQALNAAQQVTSGTLDILLNATPPSTFVTVNGASFKGGAQAAASIVSAFGVALAQSTAKPEALPLPTTLGGVTVSVLDAAGKTWPAPLFYTSPRQINFEIPEGTAAGQATVTIAYGSVTVSQKLDITAAAPGVFNAQGLAVGNVVSVKGAEQPITPLVQLDSTGTLVPVPIDVTSADQVFVVLYGTGIRNHAAAVTAAIGSATATAVYAGPQGVYVGEDQINIQLPSSLKGAGLIDVVLTVDGQQSNAVKIQVQ